LNELRKSTVKLKQLTDANCCQDERWVAVLKTRYTCSAKRTEQCYWI